MNPKHVRFVSQRSGFRNTTTSKRNPDQRDFFDLKQRSEHYRRSLRFTPHNHLRVNGKVVGKEQTLDYLAVFDA